MKIPLEPILGTTFRALAVGLAALALTAGAAQAQSRHGGPGRGFSGAPGPHFGHGPVYRPAPGFYRPAPVYRRGGWGPGVFWGGLGLGIGAAAASSYYAPGYYGAPVYYSSPVVTQVDPGYVIQGAPGVDRPATAPAAAPAAPNPIFYPRDGQSASQTEEDRQDCNRWATTQLDAMNDASVFQRATLACMDGRGYTAR